MIRFIIGRSGSGKSSLVTRGICEAIGEGRQVVLIVPEQQTVVWETLLAGQLPVTANLNLEITNFTRLANSVFREYGGMADEVIDEGSRALLVWRAMLAVWDKMSVYNGGANGDSDASASREERSIPTLMAALDELKGSGISPAAANEALTALESEDESAHSGENPPEEIGPEKSGSLTARLRDAVLVYAAYNAILHEEYIDRGDLLYNLASTLEEHPYFRGKTVFIDSFFSLTGAEERILYQIFRQADAANVTFACPPTEADSGEIQFGEVRSFYKKATALAIRAGVRPDMIERVYLTENFRHKDSPSLTAIEKQLFAYSAKVEETQNDGKVQIIKCADKYDEAEACAAIIERLLRDGCAYSDIAVVARDISSREGILDTTLRRHGIKCFMSESDEVSTSPAVRLIHAALSVGENGWQRRDIIKLIKTGLMTPSPDAEWENDLFERYITTWNIRGKKWYTGDEWSMNPEGYKIDMTDGDHAILRAVNSARSRIIPPLESLLSVFDDGPASVRDIAERIVFFAEDVRLEESLEGVNEAYRRIGMPKEGTKAASGWKSVCEILDKMVAMLADVKLDAGTFASLFLRTAASMDIGTIPTGIDEVVLGSAYGVRFDSVHYVILLGSVYGEFPGAVSDEKMFFGERDRIALEGVGLTLSTPDREERTAREYFMYYRTAVAADRGLFILAPIGDGSELSDGASRIDKIIRNEDGSSIVRAFSNFSVDEAVYHPSTAEYLLSRRVDESERMLLASLADNKDEWTSMPLEATHDTLPPMKNDSTGTMRLSQSRIEAFVTCPFRYCCEYILKLEPEKKAEIRTPDIGVFMHRILEKFFAEDRGRMPLSREETERIADSIIREYIDDLARSAGGKPDSNGNITLDGRLQYLFMRLRRYVLVFLEAIMRELAQSRFTPVAYELPIGLGKDGVSPLVFHAADGTRVILTGIADRVDTYTADDGKKYVRIIDYKTGSKNFNLQDVERGLGVQLLIYLFSIWRSGIPGISARDELIPAGAMYFSARPISASSETSITAEEAREKTIERIERSGVLINNEDILRAMDESLDGTYIPVKTDKSGALKMTGSRGGCLLAAEDFGKLANDLSDTIVKIANEMRSGKAGAKPRGSNRTDSPCSWCDHRFVCKKANSDR